MTVPSNNSSATASTDKVMIAVGVAVGVGDFAIISAAFIVFYIITVALDVSWLYDIWKVTASARTTAGVKPG